LDVLVELPLTAGEAALGTKVRVPTLTGKVELTVPPGTSSGARLRLRGLGVKSEKGGEQGDQYVIARIVLPRTLDEESRRLMREFDAKNPMDPRKDLGW
ncbi:MAG: DnaJ C-terminal domain-containing protein, partial [Phycisphaerae bacterium]|nr:DnaJ C-terminal domain-containing protein [Phycisphaerae bacterium]